MERLCSQRHYLIPFIHPAFHGKKAQFAKSSVWRLVVRVIIMYGHAWIGSAFLLWGGWQSKLEEWIQQMFSRTVLSLPNSIRDHGFIRFQVETCQVLNYFFDIEEFQKDYLKATLSIHLRLWGSTLRLILWFIKPTFIHAMMYHTYFHILKFSCFSNAQHWKARWSLGMGRTKSQGLGRGSDLTLYTDFLLAGYERFLLVIITTS